MNLISALIVIFYLINVLACKVNKCGRHSTHMQEKFCNADFVIEVLVKKIIAGEHKVIYHVEVENSYKLVSSMIELNKIEAPNCRKSCLEKMKKGMSYVISGIFLGKVAALNKCDSIVIKSSDITEEQLEGLEGDYERNCYCASKCKPSSGNLDCYNKYSYCSGYESKLERVDLSHAYGPDTMFIPGIAAPFQLDQVVLGLTEFGTVTLWFEQNKITVHEHSGTHLDAPCHVRRAEGGWKVDEIPVNRFFGDAVVIDISERAKTNIDAAVYVQDIVDWEEKYGKIKDGSIVFMHSGWDRFWGNTTAYVYGGQEGTAWRFPGFSTEAAEWLVNHRNIHGAGVDTPSLDRGISQTLGVHVAFLEASIYGLEMVTNLAYIPPTGAKVFVAPIKSKGGSGGPVRIIAEFKEAKCKWKSSTSFQKCKTDS